jgi:Sulfatase-modifying factor enzyme 1
MPTDVATARRRAASHAYFPSFQMSAASCQSFPTFSQITTYFPVTSCGFGPFVFRANVPISRAAAGPSGFTSSVVSLGVADLLRHALPHGADRVSPAHDRRARGECRGVRGVERGDPGEVTLVEELDPLAPADVLSPWVARVIRGGSYASDPRFVRSAFRSWSTSNSRASILGFRLARTLNP